jgi:hypothetical protein
VGSLPPRSSGAAGAVDPGAADPPADPPPRDAGSSPSPAPPRGGSAGATRDAAGAAGEATTPDGGAADRAAADASPSDAPAARSPRAGEVAIDELLVDPAGNDLGHEWLELANLAGEPLDLAALRISDGTSEVAVDAGVLAAGGLLVLGQSIDRAHNGDAPVDLAYGTKLSLNNGGDRVAICLGPCASGVELDVVSWTAPWGDPYTGHAVVVEPGGATCPAEEPYGGGGNFGTPGRPNPPCPAADRPDAATDGVPDAGTDGGADAG